MIELSTRGARRRLVASIGSVAAPALVLLASAPPAVAATADLSIALERSPASVPTGREITYTVKVKNLGPDAATSVAASDILPDGVLFKNAGGGGWSCTLFQEIVTCTQPLLAVGAAPPITILVEAPDTDGVLTDTASVTATETDPRTGNNTAKVETRTQQVYPANGGFEKGDLSNWIANGDVAIVADDPSPACFRPTMPSEGHLMACLSTNRFFGGASVGDLRSDLTSEPIVFNFKPTGIKVSFTVDFQTSESIQSIAHDDAFEARLITPAGTYVMVQVDPFGRTPPGRGLAVTGFTQLEDVDPDCKDASGAPFVGKRTGRLQVTWTLPLDAVLRGVIGTGPVQVEFTVSNQGDALNPSIACVDDVQVSVHR